MTIKLDWYGKAREAAKELCDVNEPFEREKTNVVIRTEEEAHSVRSALQLGYVETQGSLKKAMRRVYLTLLDEGHTEGWFDDPSPDISLEEETKYGNHEEIRRLFIDVLNIIQPEHSRGDDVYPVSFADADFSYCQPSGKYIAKCGSIGRLDEPVYFAADRKWFEHASFEKILVTLVHEVTHVPNLPGSTHSPEFWERMVEHANVLLENLDQIDEDVDVNEFKEEIVNDVNIDLIDRRRVTLEEQKEMIRDML